MRQRETEHTLTRKMRFDFMKEVKHVLKDGSK